MNNIDPISIIADDRALVIYRPDLNKITKSVISTILLQQIMYWYKKSKGEFYKFKEPCSHRSYRDGDSWIEELGFNKSEFDRALKGIGCNRKSDKALKELDEQGLQDYNEKFNSAFVIYWTDLDRKTWYSIQEPHLRKSICAIYEDPDVRYTEIDMSDIRESDIQISLLTETNKTETTQETTRDKEAAPPKIENPDLPKKIFVPPTQDEVIEYMTEIEIDDPNKQSSAYVDYYLARGWKLSRGQTMVEWKATVRTWKKNIKQFSGVNNNDKNEAINKNIEGVIACNLN